jgi:hypothetical protein
VWSIEDTGDEKRNAAILKKKEAAFIATFRDSKIDRISNKGFEGRQGVV